MFCRKCGAELEPHENFCPFCGEKILKIQDTEPVQQPAAPIHKTKQNSAGRKIGLIVGVIAVVAALAVGAYLIGRGSADNKETPVSSENTGNSNDPVEPNDVVSSIPEAPEVSPDDIPATEEPAISPGVSDMLPAPTTTETTENNSTAVDLSSLYIGMWIAKGQSEGDTQNGWTALCVDSVTGDSVTFRLEKIQSAPANRIADTYPITVALGSGEATFPVSDSWGNSGMGEITVKDGIIHVKVEITNPDPTSMWDISMDTDFYPEIGLPANTSASNGPVGLGVTEESITQEFLELGGALFPVGNTLFRAGADSSVFQFDCWGSTVKFEYRYDRSSGEISIGDMRNWSQVIRVLNTAFLVLSGNEESTSFNALPYKVYDSEPTERLSNYDEALAEEHEDYEETITDVYTGVHTADDYECTFWLYHSNNIMQGIHTDDAYGGNVKFSKSEG